METRTEQSFMPSKEVNLLCIEAPNDNKVNTISFPTSSLLHLSPKQIVGPERLEIVPAAAKLLVAPFDDILLY